MDGGESSPQRVTLAPHDHFRVIEERRRAAEAVLWQVPGISLAAQAFLLSAGLTKDAQPSSQVVVGLLGIAAVIGTALLIRYQSVRAAIFVRWLSETVHQPLRPDELAIETLNLDSNDLRRMRSAFKGFYVACGGALLSFLAADAYVLGRGAGWW